MKWPLVSRVAYEHKVAVLDARLSDLQSLEKQINYYEQERRYHERERQQERDRYDALVQELLKLKREGFGQSPAPVDFPVEEELAPLISGAILDRARFGSRDHRDLANYALEQLRLGKSEDEIAKVILEGASVEL